VKRGTSAAFRSTEERVYFWAIPNGSDRASAFLSWVEELPVAMVNHLPLTAPTDPGDLLAIATLEARLDGWVARAPTHHAEQAHLDLRIVAGGWSLEATAIIRRAVLVFLALEARERNSHAVQLVLAPFDALGPIGALLE
jgi:hypothetical protein